VDGAVTIGPEISRIGGAEVHSGSSGYQSIGGTFRIDADRRQNLAAVWNGLCESMQGCQRRNQIDIAHFVCSSAEIEQ
jgi:hypothetical protein